MKRIFTSIALVTTLSVATQAQSLDKQAFWELVHSIPSAEDLHEAYDILARRDPAQDYLFKLAENRIATAKANVPKLEALVKRNTNIFDYPGLISHGTIAYFREPAPHYMFCLQPSISHLFYVYFDERGLITDIRKLDKK